MYSSDPEDAKAAVRGQTMPLDGFLAPTWSWREAAELWSGKYKTTSFNGLWTALAGRIILFLP